MAKLEKPAGNTYPQDKLSYQSLGVKANNTMLLHLQDPLEDNGRHGENKMEEAITIWNIVLRLCLSLLLSILFPFLLRGKQAKLAPGK